METLPGLKFGQSDHDIDNSAAISYFRALVEHKIQGLGLPLASMLGLHFQPKYENLLALIPDNQIVSVKRSPLGEGERGVVYKGVWSHRRGLGDDIFVNAYVALK